MQREKGDDRIGYCWSNPCPRVGGICSLAQLPAAGERIRQPREPERSAGDTLETRLFHQSYHAIEDASPAMMKERDRVEQRHCSRLAELDDQHAATGLEHALHLSDRACPHLLG